MKKSSLFTNCSLDYLISSEVFDFGCPFVVGAFASGTAPNLNVEFSNFDLYACRLYTRILTDEEIKYNYDETTEYHNKLVKLVSDKEISKKSGIFLFKML